ncbi:LOW QUALITY PROTEIN: dentin sialophosphoprotein [Macrobrachium rosenbergii]|uniref:LOW QUALITY PROTEIN: dentin sialophosphoprotein n=1 Tax=Macrobrachium rosenbergii TaxID=79674 RepID=UPI0034D5E774
MSASRGTSGRLSRKRKNEDSSQSQLATALHDITDDFEDISTVFRLPKKSKVEKLLAPTRPRGRPAKRSQSSRTLCSTKETCDEDDFSDAASVSADEKSSQDVVIVEDGNCDLELDESFLNKDEKLCRSCKHIVPVEMFKNHLKECFQKFRLHKNTRTTTETVLSCSSHQEGKLEEKESSAAQEKENLQILPCPLCLKSFKSKSQRQSHIKTCGQSKGLSTEKVISAIRLQEKQAEERIQLGLPVVAVQSSNHEEKETATERGKRRGKNPVNNKDPDLAMAIALSRSVAEEEAEKRASEEEKLLALGLDHIVEEDRKVKPVVLLPYTSDSMKTNIKEKGRGSRGRRNFHNTVLATRSVAERERIVSERVATILASEASTNMAWKENSTHGGRGCLAKFQDKNCTLWSASSCNLEQPIEKYYVADLESHIKPKKAEVGRLLKRLSDIPGRLNVTVMQNINENSDSESDVEEASVLNDYCTQLAMAELLGSQELNVTRANGPTSPNLSSLGDLQGPSSNITLEAASGFWLIHPTETKQDSNDTATAEESEVNTCKVPNTHVDFEKTHESSNSQIIGKENDILTENRAKVIGESEISAKVLCAEDSKPIDGDGAHKFSSDFCSSEASKPVLDADDSRCRTVSEQGALVNSLTCSENEDFVNSEPNCGKNDSLFSSFRNVSSPKKLCCISLSGHILSSLHSDAQKEEDSLAQVCDGSKEQKPCSSHKSNLCGERTVISKEITEVKLAESQDSEILCLLDTTIDKDTKGSQGLPKRLSRSQGKPNQSGEPVGKVFAGDSSPDYHSLNSTSFLHRKCDTSSQKESLCSRENVEEETLDEVGKLSDNSCDSDGTEIFNIAKGNNNQDSVAWESDHGSSIKKETRNKKDEACKDDSESDDGDARTVIYDENTGDGMLPMPSSDEPCESICELETAAPFQGKEKEVNVTSCASKNSCSINKHHTFSEGSLDFRDENGVTNVPSSLQCAVDMDETRMYINSKTLYPLKSTAKRERQAINQILEAFEETIPSRYLNETNKANDTILYKNRVSAKEPLPDKNSSSLDDTLSEDMVEKLLEMTPLKSAKELDLDETLEYGASSEKNTTALHQHGDCGASKKTVVIDKNLLMEDDSNYSSEEHESQGVEGDNRSLKDCGTKSSTSNVSPELSSTKESSKINKRSGSMLTRLIYDWGSLLASGEESDVTIITNGGEELNAHSIVLLARCPELYADVKNSKRQLTWNGVSYDGAYIFLAYLYTGDCRIKTKDDPFWMDVFDLALKYKSEELISFLESLYKIGNSPIKEKSLLQKGSDSGVSEVLSGNLESTGRMIENTLIGGDGVRRKEPDKIRSSFSSSKMKPGKTSTAVRPSQMNSAEDIAIPQQTSNEFEISTNLSILSTPKADRSNRCGPRRCLDLSPIDKALSPTVLYSDGNDQVDGLRTNNISSPDKPSKSPKKKSCSIYGSQSPDLFESSVQEENVSFISMPAKSPLGVSSPEDTTVKSHSKDSVDDHVVGISNSLSSHKKSPNLQNSFSVQCDESSVCSKLGNDQGQNYESGVLHNQDECQDDNCHISKDADAKKENLFDLAKSLNTEDNSYTNDETKNDNVIDLTNDSSDDSQSSFCAVGDIVDNTTISSKTATPEYSQEDMEPLKLMESEESEKEVDEVSCQVKTDDKNEDARKGNEIAIDIICPSPNSVVSDKDDHEESRSGRAENDHSYISNVWDDFDDAGFGISVGMPLTPNKDESAENVSCLDLPSLEKEERAVDPKDNERIIGSESQSNTFKSSLPMAPPSLSDQRSLDFAASTTDNQKSSRFDQGCTKASACVSSISDDTMAKVAGDLDDSNLWKEEFEPVFEDEQMIERECSDRGNMSGYDKMKTPKQKAKTKNMITPLPNYKEMLSPELQKELKRYGIKPISRKKAIVILEHVYEKTHPLVTDSEADSSYCDTPLQPQHAKTKTGKQKVTASLQEGLAVKNSKKTKNTDDKPKKNTATKTKNNKVSQVVNVQDRIEEEEEEDSPLNLSQSSSTSSEVSELECVEESMLLGALDDDIAVSATHQGCLSSQVLQFIRSDPEFHQKVLLYEPFFVEDLQASLKANGVKCNMRGLLDILDDQCITFRTHQGQRQRQRGRKCKRKSVGTPGKSPKRSKRNNP